MKAEATMMSIYGNVVLTNSASPTTAVDYAIFGIGVWDSEIAIAAESQDPDNAQNLTDERWLYTARAVVPTGDRGTLRWKFHIKQKVKLEDMDVRIIFSNSDGLEGYEYSSNFRILLQTR